MKNVYVEEEISRRFLLEPQLRRHDTEPVMYAYRAGKIVVHLSFFIDGVRSRRMVRRIEREMAPRFYTRSVESRFAPGFGPCLE